MYIDNCGTFWFNPAKTAYVGMSTLDRSGKGLAPIEAYAAALKRNVEATGVTIIDWQVMKYFGHDAVYGIMAGPGDATFPVDYPALHDASFECSYNYYLGNSLMDSFAGATTVEEFQTILPVLATYQPAK